MPCFSMAHTKQVKAIFVAKYMWIMYLLGNLWALYLHAIHYQRNQVRTIEVINHNTSACHSDSAKRQPNLVNNKLTNHMLPSEMTSH